MLGKVAAPGLKERRLMVEMLLQDFCASKVMGAAGVEQLLRSCEGRPNSKRERRKAKHEARNTKPDTRNPKPETLKPTT